ncbi:hypothetical protein KYC5002_41285 [Archangium violaceum]|uniref:hypothetical protein n=1 Tax=Archangium violaceum TaxID=83451 RepID=UPI002B2C7F3A|nr:hypothetical protein KYC5002_41285 [Archangium gephyra]
MDSLELPELESLELPELESLELPELESLDALDEAPEPESEALMEPAPTAPGV